MTYEDQYQGTVTKDTDNEDESEKNGDDVSLGSFGVFEIWDFRRICKVDSDGNWRREGGVGFNVKVFHFYRSIGFHFPFSGRCKVMKSLFLLCDSSVLDDVTLPYLM